MRDLKNLLNFFSRKLSSDKFFLVIAGLMTVEGLWIALTARYPMAFDEDYHLGIIRLYAHHINPFWSAQPAGADIYGAVFRDPSYLYHYLMSFPYRLISLVFDSQVAQIIILRFINIGLFITGLILYKNILKEIKAPNTVINLSLLIFILVPVVPQLAGQINYDNLFIPATGLCILLAIKFCRQLIDKKALNGHLLVLILSACLLTSLVKYAFLPIGLAILVFCLTVAIKNLKKVSLAPKRLVSLKSILLAILLIVSLGLFTERYGINMLKYHTPIPDCGKVLSVESCKHYGPWNRDYNYVNHRVDRDISPAGYIDDWFYGMWLRLFFALDGPLGNYQTRGPLPMPAVSAIVFFAGGIALLVRFGRQIYKKYDRLSLSLVSIVTLIYIATLWLDEYRAFRRTGHPVAINGRYLFPILIFVITILILAYVELFKSRTSLKQATALAAIICMLWGGGSLTFILRSNDAWYWDNQAVRVANHLVKNTLKPITPGTAKPTEFLH